MATNKNWKDALRGSEVQTAKSRLLEAARQLEEAGFRRKSESLRTIIARLEDWQHTSA